jgi:excisionase family DNA binding protein
MMSIAQAAAALKMSRQRVHILIQQGRIPAKRIGRGWVVLVAKVKAA